MEREPEFVPISINVEGLECPNSCRNQSFTVKINKKPSLSRSTRYYEVYCSSCGEIIEELLVDEYDK